MFMIFLPPGITSSLSQRPNTEKSAARPPYGEFGNKSGKTPAVICLQSPHLAVVWRRPGKFNSQLKFARWSADVTQINSSAGVPWDAARLPAGLRSATRGNLGCNWQKKTHGRPHGDQPFSVGTLDGDPGVICRQPRHGKSPNGIRWETAGLSLDTLILSAVISIWRDLWDVKQQWVIKIKSFII